MTIQDLGSIGEFIAAIATIATLAYLAIQIRQNTAVVRTSNFADLAAHSIVLAEVLSENGELRELYSRGIHDFQGLAEDEQLQFHMLMSRQFHSLQTMFQLSSKGMIDNDLMARNHRINFTLMEFLGVRQWWEQEKTWWDSDFVSYIEKGLEERENLEA